MTKTLEASSARADWSGLLVMLLEPSQPNPGASIPSLGGCRRRLPFPSGAAVAALAVTGTAFPSRAGLGLSWVMASVPTGHAMPSPPSCAGSLAAARSFLNRGSAAAEVTGARALFGCGFLASSSFRRRRSPAQGFRQRWSGAWRCIARAVATSDTTHARFAWIVVNRCVSCMSWEILTVRASAFASCASALELTAG